MKYDSDSTQSSGFSMAALREINVLLNLTHPNIVRVTEMVMGRDISKIFMVMEYMECDLKKAVGGLTEVSEELHVFSSHAFSSSSSSSSSGAFFS